jgi:glycosyltransferase involved in cell wall biosynthesis
MNFSRLIVISDFQQGEWDGTDVPSVPEFRDRWRSAGHDCPTNPVDKQGEVEVEGGYIERLPLACIKAGLVDGAEVWTHWRGATPPSSWTEKNTVLTRRAFRLNGPDAPFSSNDMLGHIEAFGPPAILCVWGLGVSEDVLFACRDSFKIYNSIDAPALRVPHAVSRHFDLVLTGAEWQSKEVGSRHLGMPTAVMPIGPEFASDRTFHPLDVPKLYDIIYVGAAQAYKRHDILFEALGRLSRSLRTLCVCGYGELIPELRAHVARLGINVDFVEPPGVPFEEVNRLMNTARMGVVCGVDDGAPAILTEYMLAGIPVLANSALSCGRQYIMPKTGRIAAAEQFHEGISEMLADIDEFAPRDVVMENWIWPHSVDKLRHLIADAKHENSRTQRNISSGP